MDPSCPLEMDNCETCQTLQPKRSPKLFPLKRCLLLSLTTMCALTHLYVGFRHPEMITVTLSLICFGLFFSYLFGLEWKQKNLISVNFTPLTVDQTRDEDALKDAKIYLHREIYTLVPVAIFLYFLTFSSVIPLLSVATSAQITFCKLSFFVFVCILHGKISNFKISYMVNLKNSKTFWINDECQEDSESTKQEKEQSQQLWLYAKYKAPFWCCDVTIKDIYNLLTFNSPGDRFVCIRLTQHKIPEIEDVVTPNSSVWTDKKAFERKLDYVIFAVLFMLSILETIHRAKDLSSPYLSLCVVCSWVFYSTLIAVSWQMFASQGTSGINLARYARILVPFLMFVIISMIEGRLYMWKMGCEFLILDLLFFCLLPSVLVSFFSKEFEVIDALPIEDTENYPCHQDHIHHTVGFSDGQSICRKATKSSKAQLLKILLIRNQISKMLLFINTLLLVASLVCRIYSMWRMYCVTFLELFFLLSMLRNLFFFTECCSISRNNIYFAFLSDLVNLSATPYFFTKSVVIFIDTILCDQTQSMGNFAFSIFGAIGYISFGCFTLHFILNQDTEGLDIENCNSEQFSEDLGIVDCNPGQSTEDMGIADCNPEQSTEGLRIVDCNPEQSTDNLGIIDCNPEQSTEDLGIVDCKPEQSTDDLGIIDCNPEQSTEDLGIMDCNSKQSTENMGIMDCSPKQSTEDLGIMDCSLEHSIDFMGIIDCNPKQSTENMGIMDCNPKQSTEDLGIMDCSQKQSTDDLGITDCNPEQFTDDLEIVHCSPKQFTEDLNDKKFVIEESAEEQNERNFIQSTQILSDETYSAKQYTKDLDDYDDFFMIHSTDDLDEGNIILKLPDELDKRNVIVKPSEEDLDNEHFFMTKSIDNVNDEYSIMKQTTQKPDDDCGTVGITEEPKGNPDRNFIIGDRKILPEEMNKIKKQVYILYYFPLLTLLAFISASCALNIRHLLSLQDNKTKLYEYFITVITGISVAIAICARKVFNFENFYNRVKYSQFLEYIFILGLGDSKYILKKQESEDFNDLQNKVGNDSSPKNHNLRLVLQHFDNVNQVLEKLNNELLIVGKLKMRLNRRSTKYPVRRSIDIIKSFLERFYIILLRNFRFLLRKKQLHYDLENIKYRAIVKENEMEEKDVSVQDAINRILDNFQELNNLRKIAFVNHEENENLHVRVQDVYEEINNILDYFCISISDDIDALLVNIESVTIRKRKLESDELQSSPKHSKNCKTLEFCERNETEGRNSYDEDLKVLSEQCEPCLVDAIEFCEREETEDQNSCDEEWNVSSEPYQPALDANYHADYFSEKDVSKEEISSPQFEVVKDEIETSNNIVISLQKEKAQCNRRVTLGNLKLEFKWDPSRNKIMQSQRIECYLKEIRDDLRAAKAEGIEPYIRFKEFRRNLEQVACEGRMGNCYFPRVTIRGFREKLEVQEIPNISFLEATDEITGQKISTIGFAMDYIWLDIKKCVTLDILEFILKVYKKVEKSYFCHYVEFKFYKNKRKEVVEQTMRCEAREDKITEGENNNINEQYPVIRGNNRNDHKGAIPKTRISKKIAESEEISKDQFYLEILEKKAVCPVIRVDNRNDHKGAIPKTRLSKKIAQSEEICEDQFYLEYLEQEAVCQGNDSNQFPYPSYFVGFGNDRKKFLRYAAGGKKELVDSEINSSPGGASSVVPDDYYSQAESNIFVPNVCFLPGEQQREGYSSSSSYLSSTSSNDYITEDGFVVL